MQQNTTDISYIKNTIIEETIQIPDVFVIVQQKSSQYIHSKNLKKIRKSSGIKPGKTYRVNVQDTEFKS